MQERIQVIPKTGRKRNRLVFSPVSETSESFRFMFSYGLYHLGKNPQEVTRIETG